MDRQTNTMTGIVRDVGQLETFSGGFTKRTLIVTLDHDSKYPQHIAVEFCKERADLLQNVAEGDTVRVSHDLRGREYNGRYYVLLSGWRIQIADDDAPDDAPPPPLNPAAKEPQQTAFDESDAIPF